MIDYLGCLAADSLALADAARTAGLGAPVPTCPDWRVRDLVGHVLVIHRWVEEVVRTRAVDRPERDLSVPSDGELVAAFEAGAAALVETLRSAALDAPAWNWSLDEPREAAFWRRRMAQETAVHRWDGQAAVGAGSVAPVDTALAVDGVDEMLGVFLPAGAAWFPERRLVGSLHLHCVDTEGEWLVSMADGSVVLSRAPGSAGDAAVQGSASDLLLFVWNRLAPGEASLSVFGDEAVIESWRSIRL